MMRQYKVRGENIGVIKKYRYRDIFSTAQDIKGMMRKYKVKGENMRSKGKILVITKYTTKQGVKNNQKQQWALKILVEKD